MNSSYCPWAVEINDLFDKGYDMINKDFVNTKALMEALRKDTADFNGTPTEIQEALKILKFTSIPQQASYNGKQRRVWARNRTYADTLELNGRYIIDFYMCGFCDRYHQPHLRER
jgi:hypothetical protein